MADSNSPDSQFDFDQIVVGSGFGGSCSALRLSEKGHRVLVLEKGKRWRDEDLPETNWNILKGVWAPLLGIKGMYQVTPTKKFIALHAAGVGGGSLVYGNVHLIPEDKVFESPSWKASKPDWKKQLLPFYGLAQRMIGVAENIHQDDADHTLEKVANVMGKGDTFKCVNTGILFPTRDENGNEIGEWGEDMGDPYFAGDGPQRNSCQYCGACMVGCRHNAKNTLVKNYLYFAERNGVEVRPESRVLKIRPLGAGNGDDGYEITVRDTSKFLRPRTYTVTTRGVVLSAGVVGTVSLLMDHKHKNNLLPKISNLLGQQVRTNSETLIPVSTRKKDANGDPVEVCNNVGISTIMSPDDETNIEVVRYNKGSDMSFIGTVTVPMVDGGNGEGIPRGLRLLGTMIKRPIHTLKCIYKVGSAKNTIWFLVMQTKEAYIHMELKRRWYKGFRNSWEVVQHDGDAALSAYFPSAHKAAREYVKESGGEAMNILAEVVANIPLTAHIMSGVRIGTDAENGVVDETGEVFGYKNLRVLDASIIPGNLGVNPSLSILALTEHAMSKLPIFNKARAEKLKPISFSKPLNGQVSHLKGEGDLLADIIATDKTTADDTLVSS